jgi:hypothetical protein
MSKTCNHCGEEKPLNEFNWRYKSLGIRQPCCRECQKAQKNEWYARNQPSERERLRKQKADNTAASRAYIWDYLLNHPCVDCGESDPRVLEFDHVRGEKRAPVSTMVRNNSSPLAIQDEISKCEVRCSNCHRRRHYKEYGGFRS